ncbi:hypothetical protein LWC34_45175 [Kibdelosporangium philippinense]|uniref:Transcriptional regulator n=1 Tax=Kibdelosporangium philippinense TaxID=211113 RepID=A0ABS8ZQT0_9PSEU|nr:hypothetical protein [Kibdelosporangium philippinense]MCE7009952.1 hypothetical protein [Kibdelosporangium philippinense]
MPLHAVDLSTGRQQESSSGAGKIDGAADGWEAMSPLNRRLLLRHGVGAAAVPWFAVPGSASPPSPGSSFPGDVGRASLPSTSWAIQIHNAVLSPTDAIRTVGAADDGRVANVPELQRSAHDALTAHLSSDYAKLATDLPSLIGRVEWASLQGTDSPDIQTLLSDAYGVAAWSLIKADSPVAAWIAAERSIKAAEQADDVLRIAAATRCLSEVHMRASNFEEATRTAFLATVQLDTAKPAQRQTALSLRGAALLSGAAAAARRGSSREAYAALRAAATCAEELGDDRIDLGTVFGPTNVAIHEVAIAVELGDTRQALHHVSAVKLNRMPAALTERRARFLIDVARSHHGQGDDEAAVGALLEAEHIAADEVREHRLTHDLLRDLLSRERRSSGVRELAGRCNLLN